MSVKKRIAAGLLGLSVAGIGGIAIHEGYKDTAYIPVPGDVPTIGHGTTRYEDGAPVKLGDKVTKERAVQLLKHDANRFEVAVRKCAAVPLTQDEFDAYVSLTYNIGEQAFCRSTIVKRLKQAPPDYEGACQAILMWDKFQGRTLPGLTKRRQHEYGMCMR